MAEAVKDYLSEQNIETCYVDPGAPWENGYVEAFNSRFRDELLGRELFATTLEVQVLCEQWRCFYNEERPHNSLGYQTPTAFNASYETTEIIANQVPALT